MRKLDFLFFHFFVIDEEKINWDSMRDRGTADGASPAAGCWPIYEICTRLFMHP